MRISDWSSDVCSSDLVTPAGDKKRISYVEEGSFLAKMLNVPIDVKGRLSPKDTTKFLRLGRHKQSNTLQCGEIFFHPTEERYLTPREYMRLHGFPDDYALMGDRKSTRLNSSH